MRALGPGRPAPPVMRWLVFRGFSGVVCKGYALIKQIPNQRVVGFLGFGEWFGLEDAADGVVFFWSLENNSPVHFPET